MMNRLRNSDRPTITWFGGIACTPRALRVSESTMTMRVKLVHRMSSAGAIDMTVSSSTTTTARLGASLPPSRSTVSEPVSTPGTAGAAGAGAATASAVVPLSCSAAGAGAADAPVGTTSSTVSARGRASSRSRALRRADADMPLLSGGGSGAGELRSGGRCGPAARR